MMPDSSGCWRHPEEEEPMKEGNSAWIWSVHRLPSVGREGSPALGEKRLVGRHVGLDF